MTAFASSLRHAFAQSPTQADHPDQGVALAHLEFDPSSGAAPDIVRTTDGLHLVLPMPALDCTGMLTQASETWLTCSGLQRARHGMVQVAHDENLLFGSVHLQETRFSTDADGELPPLQAATQTAYTAIFAVLDQLGFRQALRFWNYMPGINCNAHGLERYRQFNMGRQSGFLSSGRQVEGSVVPPATAVGYAAGPLAVHFLAARTARALTVENPRQVSAYHYPEQYGPRTPTFSRASLAYMQEKPALFISGTASIVGHASLHPGDVVAQTNETVENIAAVINEANRLAPDAHFTLAEMAYRVYVRHPADCPAIEHVLRRLLGPSARLLYLQADICREELLLEIEAVGGLG